MKEYIFKTTATMKEYNCKHWWIDGGIIPEKRIKAENLSSAIEAYRNIVDDRHYISISDRAIKNKSEMFVDTPEGSKQVGYVITGKTEFQRDNGEWSTQYIDLWVTILTVIPTEFPEESR